LSNYGGWLLAALVLSLAMQALLTTAPDGADVLPVALYLWLYAGWVVALAVFLHLPAAAGWGALGMGTVALPLARRVLR
jgi:putative membrane protein